MSGVWQKIGEIRMSKYIVKNCPVYCYLGKECHNKEGQYGASCCEVTDCVLKQIVEKCKLQLQIYRRLNR